MKHPLVSVIIPTFNRAWSIKRAVDSVLNQTFRDFELIVVDDGSNDNTLEILKKYDDKIQIISQINLGVSAARNSGIKHSRGEYVAFLDSDDEWLPKKLEAQIGYLNENPSVNICQTVERWIRYGKFVNIPNVHKKVGGNIFEQSLKKCMITCSSVIMRKSLLDEVGLFNETMPACEDYDLWLRITYKYEVGLLEKEYLVRYGGHKDQLSTKYNGNDKYRIRSMMNILESCQLTKEQRYKTLESLERKCRIYAQGCIKRGKKEIGKRFMKIPELYRI